MDQILKDILTRMLGNDGPVLIYKCAECGKIDAIAGYENIHDATETQLAAESRKIFCDECEEVD